MGTIVTAGRGGVNASCTIVTVNGASVNTSGASVTVNQLTAARYSINQE